jgi:dolichol-phosphate mannosyltransferase
MNKLYVIIPAYNEEESIEQVVKEWHEVVSKIGNDSRLVILNDGSKDKTMEILERMRPAFPDLNVINKKNSGHGPTCLMGYKYAIDNGSDFIFQTDSDGQTQAEDFWKFWEKKDECDLVIGFRSTRGDGAARWFVSRTLRLVLFGIFGTYAKDANTPFRLMRTDRLRKYIGMIPDDFFLTNSMLTILFIKSKEKIGWIKIDFEPRTGGTSSISFKRFFKIGLRTVKELFSIKNKIKI